jgi:hypothetical protein
LSILRPSIQAQWFAISTSVLAPGLKEPQAVTQSLYDLATHPEYVTDMRDEAETIITEDGWTKAAMQRMHKIDSFLKESQRLNSGGSRESVHIRADHY